MQHPHLFDKMPMVGNETKLYLEKSWLELFIWHLRIYEFSIWTENAAKFD